MDAIIIPSRIIIGISDNGKAREVVLQYKVRADGAVDARFRTIGVDKGIEKDALAKIIEQAVARAKDGEGTNLTKIRLSEAEVKEKVKKRLQKKEGGAK